jgi:hypothetical protein
MQIRHYDIWCGSCGTGDSTTGGDLTYKKAVREFRSQGWSKTKARGWICPDCARCREEEGDE